MSKPSTPLRMVINSDDAMHILGRSLKYAQQELKRIRVYYKKRPGELVTVWEFCTYMRMDVQYVIDCINR